jgi:excisionase family DNA binding protein
MNPTVTLTRADLDKAVADAVAQALKALGFGARKAKPAPPKIGYSVKEAAVAASVGRTTIYAAVRRGELRIVKKGARSIILDRDLRRWLECLPPSNV